MQENSLPRIILTLIVCKPDLKLFFCLRSIRKKHGMRVCVGGGVGGVGGKVCSSPPPHIHSVKADDFGNLKTFFILVW